MRAVPSPTWTWPSPSWSGDEPYTTSSTSSSRACWSHRWRYSGSHCHQTPEKSWRSVSTSFRILLDNSQLVEYSGSPKKICFVDNWITRSKVRKNRAKSCSIFLSWKGHNVHIRIVFIRIWHKCWCTFEFAVNFKCVNCEAQ